jgi:hypothetical protein
VKMRHHHVKHTGFWITQCAVCLFTSIAMAFSVCFAHYTHSHSFSNRLFLMLLSLLIAVGWGISRSKTLKCISSFLAHVALLPYFRPSSCPRSTTRSSRRAHNTTLNTKPGKYPPPTVMPSLHVRACQSSKSARSTHVALFAGMMYFSSASAASSGIYGTGLRSCLVDAVVVAGTFQPYPTLFFVFSSDVFIIPTCTGGSGKKYSAYALARKLAIATRLGRRVSRRARSRVCRNAGMSGSAVSRSV